MQKSNDEDGKVASDAINSMPNGKYNIPVLKCLFLREVHVYISTAG